MGWLIAFVVVGIVGVVAAKTKGTETSSKQLPPRPGYTPPPTGGIPTLPGGATKNEARIAYLLGRGDQATPDEARELLVYLLPLAGINDIPADRVMTLRDKKESGTLSASEQEEYMYIASKLFALAESGKVPGFGF